MSKKYILPVIGLILVCVAGISVYLILSNNETYTEPPKIRPFEKPEVVEKYELLLESLLGREEAERVKTLNAKQYQGWDTFTDKQRRLAEELAKKQLEGSMACRVMTAYLGEKQPADISLKTLEEYFGVPSQTSTSNIIYRFDTGTHVHRFEFELEETEGVQDGDPRVKDWLWGGARRGKVNYPNGGNQDEE